MYLLTVAVITMCAGLVYGQSSQCQTPDGKGGECISLLKCRPLLEQLDKPNKTDQDLLMLSKLLTKLHCGSVRVPFLPKVCCASEQQDSEAEAVYSNGTCMAHDGRPGKCISQLMCPYVEDMIVNGSGSTLWEKSKCKLPEGSICCPNRPNQIVQQRPGEALSKPRTDCQAKTTAFPPDPKSGCCGHWEGADDNIAQVGLGTLVVEHPWLALIEYENRDNELVLLCAGSLISGKYVLTAAHCIDGKLLNVGKPKQVRLGEYDITQEGADCMTVPAHLQRSSRTGDDGMDCTEGVTRIRIEKTISHPGYNDKLISQWNDIGLIRLEETAPYTDFIRPICLPAKDLSRPANTSSYSSVYAVGWGLVELGREHHSKVKLSFEAPLVSHEKCLLNHNNHSHYAFTPVPLRQSHLCAGGTEAIDNCTDDDGGPLVYEHQKRFQLIGVKSFGPVLCIEKDFPGVYTNVYEYLDWIKSVIIQ